MNSLYALIFVLGHGGNPVATTIKFPPQYPDSVWATTTTQGIFARIKNGYRWLCEDAFAPEAGVRDFGVVGEGEGRWLVSTSNGLFLTTTNGCDSDLVRGPLRGHRPGPISVNPTALDEVVVATRTANRRNDVFFSDDAGETFVAVGLDVDGVTKTMVRSEAEPARIYVSTETGLARSEDGGRSFAPLPPPADAEPGDVRFLATDPIDPNVVFAYRERFPSSTLYRSEDAGDTWADVLEVDDVSLGLVLSADGAQALLTAPLERWHRSADGGRTWRDAEPLVPRIGCLTRGPSGALYACANPLFMGPWVIGTSADFGESWGPALDLFDNIESQWDCGPETRAWRCCDGYCPGNQTGPECDDGTGPIKAGCEAPDNSWDGGVEPDAGDAGGLDDAAAPPADGALAGDGGAPDIASDGARPDAAPEPEDGGGGGCQSTGGPAAAWGLLLLGYRRRRTLTS